MRLQAVVFDTVSQSELSKKADTWETHEIMTVPKHALRQIQ